MTTGPDSSDRVAAIAARLRAAGCVFAEEEAAILLEDGVAPGKSEVLTGAAGSLPVCSYPDYPRYEGGDVSQAASYRCAAPELGAR